MSICVLNIKCEQATELALSNPEATMDIAASLVKMLSNFSQNNDSFKSDAIALTSSTQQDVDNNTNPADISTNWTNKWESIKAEYNNLNDSLAQIKDTSDKLFNALWNTNYTIHDLQSKQKDSIENRNLELRWNKVYNLAKVSLDNANSLIDKGDDVEKLLGNYAARQQIITSIESLNYISNQAKILASNINSFTLNANEIFQSNVILKNPNDTNTFIPQLSSTQPSTDSIKNIENVDRTNINEISCEIDNLTTEEDVYENNMKGMNIHFFLKVNNMLNRNGQCAVFFYYENGAPLKANDSNYTTTGGHVYTAEKFIPTYTNCIYNDFKIFIPYEALNLVKGDSYSLKASVYVYDISDGNNRQLLKQSDFVHFTLNTQL